MNLNVITPLVLTWNEEPNLRRCLERLAWAKDVIVLDSSSTDATAEIAAEFSNVRLTVRPFDDHTNQWNFGVDDASTRWVLALDADYMLGEGFEGELAALPEEPECDAFFAEFRYLIHGRPLRACLYPPRAVLFRKDRCRYQADGHTQLLHIPGSSASLDSRIDHDDRKCLSRWFLSQDKYAKLEAHKLRMKPAGELGWQDKLRLMMLPAPFAVFFYTLIVRGTVLDGWHGWFYAFQRMVAELMLSLRLLEARLLRWLDDTRDEASGR